MRSIRLGVQFGDSNQNFIRKIYVLNRSFQTQPATRAIEMTLQTVERNISSFFWNVEREDTDRFSLSWNLTNALLDLRKVVVKNYSDTFNPDTIIGVIASLCWNSNCIRSPLYLLIDGLLRYMCSTRSQGKARLQWEAKSSTTYIWPSITHHLRQNGKLLRTLQLLIPVESVLEAATSRHFWRIDGSRKCY